MKGEIDTTNMEIFKNKLYESDRVVYAQIGKDVFELHHKTTIESPEQLVKLLENHPIYLLRKSG